MTMPKRILADQTDQVGEASNVLDQDPERLEAAAPQLLHDRGIEDVEKAHASEPTEAGAVSKTSKLLLIVEKGTPVGSLR